MKQTSFSVFSSSFGVMLRFRKNKSAFPEMRRDLKIVIILNILLITIILLFGHLTLILEERNVLLLKVLAKTTTNKNIHFEQLILKKSHFPGRQ